MISIHNWKINIWPDLGRGGESVGEGVLPGRGLGVGWTVGIGARPVSTPGLAVTGVGTKPGVGTGPAVGLTGHLGTWQHEGSLGSGTKVHSAGTLVYLAHLKVGIKKD